MYMSTYIYYVLYAVWQLGLNLDRAYNHRPNHRYSGWGHQGQNVMVFLFNETF